MPVKIKVDEDLPRAAAKLLRKHGYDACRVVDQGMRGWKDPAIWPVIQAEKRFLVTADKSFVNVHEKPPGTHAGVLLLRPDEDGVEPILELLTTVLETIGLESLTGTVTSITPERIRIRRPGGETEIRDL